MPTPKQSRHGGSSPRPCSALSKRELTILRRALRAAECMACMCYNGKQQDAIPEEYRRSMSETGTAFDEARRQFTRKMRRVLVG